MPPELTGENGWKVGYNGNQLRFTANGVIDVTAPAANFTVVADTWYHMAASVEGTAGTRTVRFYVNGDEVYNTTFANIATSTSPNMMIGNNGQEDPGTPGGASFNENFDGNIDEIRLYDTVLTRNEIIAAAAPVPEPAGVALIVAASAAVALRRRSKRG
ncbi:MAG: LamG domain-containing protein [Verrucomicrobiales bacterium]